jgi:hypothetical protein
LDAAPAGANIEISVSRLQQLFNSLDPSPFYERDLDHDAEEYILGSAEELPLKRALRHPLARGPAPHGRCDRSRKGDP